MNPLKKYKIEDDSNEEDEEDNEIKTITNIINNNSKVIKKEEDSKLISNNKVNSNKQDILINQEKKNSNLIYKKADDALKQENNNFNVDFEDYDEKINNNNSINNKGNSYLINESAIKENPPSKNFHHVQIIDEDVENFKRRLDIMVKNFRTDTLNDFMAIKRHLLVEQKSVIESEKQKCEALISAKINQIEHLKENLAQTKITLSKEIEIKERMSLYLFKQKDT